jgi:tetratricopeptide (TPR) repeat protein
MKTIDFSYFIERYNAGEMSDTEKLWFDKELNGNKKLREEVNLRKKTDEVLKNQDLISLRNKLSSIERSRSVNVPETKPKRPLHIKYAALIAVAIILGSLAIFSGRNLSTDEILKRYTVDYKPTSNQRSSGVITNEYFTQGLEYFNTHDYKNAALYFSKVVENEPKDMYANLLSGISNYEVSRYSEAKQSLGIVIDDKKNLYIDQAQWYLALCFLQTREKEKSIQLFKKIKNEGGYYSKNAKVILRKIN